MKKFVRSIMEQAIFTIGSVGTNKSLFDETPKEYQGSNKSYQKFIVIAHQRSGSTMVIATLGSHPNIIEFGEIFVSYNFSNALKGDDQYSFPMLFLRNKYPTEYLERHIFSSFRNDVLAVGFKLFPPDLDNNNFKVIWNWISENKDIKIIYLHRKNLLASYASKIMAKKTGRFHISNESQRTNTKVKINHKKCLEYFIATERYMKSTLERLLGHDLLEITYEDMIIDLDKSFAKLQQFLGVEVISLKSIIIKKEIRPLSNVLSNYDQLCDQFMNTKWEVFFEEGNDCLASRRS